MTALRRGRRSFEPIIRGQNQSKLNIISNGAFNYGARPGRMDPPTTYIGIDSIAVTHSTALSPNTCYTLRYYRSFGQHYSSLLEDSSIYKMFALCKKLLRFAHSMALFSSDHYFHLTKDRHLCKQSILPCMSLLSLIYLPACYTCRV